MSMHRAVLFPARFAASVAQASEAPNLGRAATAAAIARADLTTQPDGSNLPAGSGSVAEGAAIYQQKCLACHGENGAGGPMDRLTDGIGSLNSPRPIKTVASFWPYATTVFDYVRRAMPPYAPQSLSNDETYAVTAYILSIDGIVSKDARLDAAALPRVNMPNRDGFISWENNLAR